MTDTPLSSSTALVDALGKEYAELLVRLLAAIRANSGFGGVEIVVSDGRIFAMRQTQSYQVLHRHLPSDSCQQHK